MRRPTGGLWSHPDFLKLWTGQTISEFGSQISALAIPLLAAITLHASAFEFSLLGVLGFLPFILFALPAGVWVDRLHRRYILIAGDAARAVLLALIPVLWAIGALRMWQLLVLQFVIGVFTVFFDVAYQSYLPALIEREHLLDGNSKLQLTVSVTQVAGPSVSGILIGAIPSFWCFPTRIPRVYRAGERAAPPSAVPDLRSGNRHHRPRAVHVELRAGVGEHLGPGGGRSPRGAVRPRLDHRAVRVGGGDDPAGQRDLPAREAGGIACPIPALVMRPDGGDHLWRCGA
jgi:hypothetical protein